MHIEKVLGHSAKPLFTRIFTLIFNFGINLVIASLLSRTYGQYFFGLWATFSSIVTLLAFLDLTIPQLLFNYLTSKRKILSSFMESDYVRSTQLVLSLVSLIFLVITMIVFALGGFDEIFPD